MMSPITILIFGASLAFLLYELNSFMSSIFGFRIINFSKFKEPTDPEIKRLERRLERLEKKSEIQERIIIKLAKGG